MELADQHGMLYLTEGPLSEVVSHYYHLFNSDNQPMIKHLAPNLEIMMIFNFGPVIRISFGNDPLELAVDKGGVVIGPLKKMLNYELQRGADAIVVHFKLNGFYRLFKIPVHDLDSGKLYQVDVLTDQSTYQELYKQLTGIVDLKARLSLISNFVMNFISANDDAVQALLQGERYFYKPAVQPAKAIAADNRLTARTIQLRFQKYTGYSPKELLRFLRFKTVIDHLMQQKGQSIDIFAVILTFGYHDQSHLIKDFQHYLGTTPQQFLRQLKDNEFHLTGHGPKSDEQIS